MIIKNGRVIDPKSGFDGIADIIIKDGKIKKILKEGKVQKNTTITGNMRRSKKSCVCIE